MKVVRIESQYQDELGTATNMGLRLLMAIDDKGAAQAKKGGWGLLKDITDETNLVYEFPFEILSKGAKLILDYGESCALDEKEVPGETLTSPKGERYAFLILPSKIEVGAIMKTQYDGESFNYKISSITDF